VQPQAVFDLGLNPPRRTLVGHVFALGVYVFIFGVLAYLAYLSQGGMPGQLLLIYVSAIPVAIAIGTIGAIARARQRLAAHHVVGGCVNAVLLCGVGGIWLLFWQQIMLTLLGSLALVWLTRYSPAARFLQPPTVSDVAGSAPLPEHPSARTWATLAGALALLVAGIGLTLFALFSQTLRPGGLSVHIGA
jgi:hypothetical protein